MDKNQLTLDEGATLESLKKQIEALMAENARLRANQGGSRIRVSQKGAISVYNLNSLPVTLYRRPMEKLLGMKDEILQFIKDHESELAVKPEDYETIRDEQKERGLESAAIIMMERTKAGAKQLEKIAKAAEAKKS